MSMLVPFQGANEPTAIGLIKPGFTKVATEVIDYLQRMGFSVRVVKSLKLPPEAVKVLYPHHADKDFFRDLTEYMCSGYVTLLFITQPVSSGISSSPETLFTKLRVLLGAEPCELWKNSDDSVMRTLALAKKIRDKWGVDFRRNVLHVSDCHDSFVRELALFTHLMSKAS